MSKHGLVLEVPDLSLIENELKREQSKSKYGRVLRSTIYALIVVAAVAVLIAVFWLPVFRIYGTSMVPTVEKGDIVVSVKGSRFDSGDIVGLYVGNRLLVKRVIAGPGQWVDMTDDGTVYVDGEMLDEPYIREKAFGDCNIELPYQVPDGKYFVMGDNRATSADSRHTSIGCIEEEQIVGRVLMRLWPLNKIGGIGE